MILPIYAGVRAAAGTRCSTPPADLGRRRRGAPSAMVILPMIFPSIVAGSIFTFSLTLGDYIAVQIVGGNDQLLGNVVYQNVVANNLPFAAALATLPGRRHDRLPARRAPHRRPGQPVRPRR